MYKIIFILSFFVQACTPSVLEATNLIEKDMTPRQAMESLYAQYDFDFQAVGRVMDQDVHVFNKSNLTPGDYVRSIMPHDHTTQENLSVTDIKNAFFSQPIKEIGLINSDLQKINLSFNALIAHTTKASIEMAETKLNVAQVFSRVWHLIDLEEDLFEKESKLSALSLVMCDNAGGCYQGYAGRIAHLYIIWTRKAIFSL